MPHVFELGMCLGQGGFGIVYDAHMTSPSGLRRRVALKLLRDPRMESVERLKREGQLLALVHHPCVPDVVDIVTLGGHTTLVTEYVPGLDLCDALSHSQPPLGAAYALVAAIADCLDAAYSAVDPRSGKPVGLVHRDIKSSNLRIERTGAVRLLDFGIAFAHCESADTRGTSMLGSVQYMAPERFTRTQAQPASDVYALGCVLAECLSGRRLHLDADIATIARTAADPVVHAQRVQETLGPYSSALCESMLAYDAAERPSAADVARRAQTLADPEALRSWAKALPSVQTRPGPLTGKRLTDGASDTIVSVAGLDSMELERTLPVNPPWQGRLIARIGIILCVVFAAVGLTSALWTLNSEPAGVSSTRLKTTPSVSGLETAAPLIEAPPQRSTAPEPAPNPATRSAQPTAAPRPRPAPEPTPPAMTVATLPQAPQTGTVVMSGSVPFTLRADGQDHPPGTLPIGQYSVFADFGHGWVDADLTVDIRDNALLTIRCNAIRWRCVTR